MQINILFDDEIQKNWDGPDDYVVTFGGNVVWRKPVSNWRYETDDQLDEGRTDFAERLREVLTPEE